jgi:hypothetical protein
MFAGAARLDFRFVHSSGLIILGDVTSVSDDELTRRNPVPQLADEIWRRLRAEGLDGGFVLSIGADVNEGHGRSKSEVSLALPPPHEFTKYIFAVEFESFLVGLRERNGPKSYIVNNPKARLTITYTPGHSQTTVTHLDYKSPRDIVRNALYNRLKHKVDQFKRAQIPADSGARGVVICDAGSGVFGPAVGRGILGFEQIAQHFLRRTRTLDFVAAIGVEQSTHWGTGASGGYAFNVQVIDGPRRGTAHIIRRTLSDGLAQLPRPVRTPINARAHLKWQEQAGINVLSFYDCAPWEWSAQRMKMSARACIDYLLGRTDRTTFERLVDSWALSLLRKTIETGGLVTTMRLERMPAHDDDQIVLEWCEHDAAVAPFR